MSNWRTLFEKAGQQPYLGHWDLEVNGTYQSREVVILEFYVGDFVTQGGKEKKVMAKLQGFTKPMVMNKENMKRLKKFFGTDNYEQFIGKPVVLTVEKTFSATDKEMVDCLRFSSRPIAGTTQQVLPPISDEEFEKAKANILAGKSTVEKVKKARTLTKEQEDELSNIQ